jgi:hypothetical protein
LKTANFSADPVNGKPRSESERGFFVNRWNQRVMAKRQRQPDSLFRTVAQTLRQGTYTFCPGTQEQRPELSDSLVNSGRPVNRPVRTGTYNDFELVGEGGVA